MRKQNYIKRHSNEDWSRANLLSPAWLSRFILWENPSLEEAIKNADQKYKDIGEMSDEEIKKLEYKFDNSIVAMLK